MAVDLLTINVMEAAVATTDVTTTAAVVVAIETTERVSMDVVDVAGTTNHDGVG